MEDPRDAGQRLPFCDQSHRLGTPPHTWVRVGFGHMLQLLDLLL
jgi:hypothetical protein